MPQSSAMLTIELNGEPYTIEGDARLTTLLEKLEVRPGRVAVEINREVIPKALYDHVTFKPGDRVEIINFVGGG